MQPELPDHPDFVLLKNAVGEYALEALIRLWGHCQNNNRGDVWLGKGSPYVEAVARWTGNRGELYRALVEFGWVDEFEGGVKMHNWAFQNARLVSARSNGRNGGRPRKQGEINPTETQGKPSVVSEYDGFSGTEKTGSTEGVQKPNDNPTITQAEPNRNPRQTHPSNPSTLSLPSLQREANRLIGVLNALTGSTFNPPLMELDTIVARLQETGGDGDGVEQMLRRQVALWKNDPRASQWLKPGTLFGANFHDYYGQRLLSATPPPATGFKKRGEQTTDRTELLQTLAATRSALDANPADAALKNRVRELELQTA